MSRTRVHNFSISLDGFATGEPQSLEAPFGHAGQRLHTWMMATRFWDPNGSDGVDHAFAQRHSDGIGAEIMGAPQVRPTGMAGRSELDRLVGREPALPHPRVRVDPPSTVIDRAGRRHHLPLPRRQPRPRAGRRPRGGRRPGRPDRWRAEHAPRFPGGRLDRSPAPGRGADRARPRRPASGTAWKASRPASMSKPSPHPAASLT